jgi:hypothetical protein
MRRSDLGLRIAFFVLFFVSSSTLSVAAPTSVIRNGRINNASLAIPSFDPCAGMNIGDTCTNGGLYAGTGFAGLGNYKYMTTPGNCSGFVNNFTEFTPTCTGTVDNLSYQYANNSGTTAYGVNTGATSMTDGAGNTAILAVNYTDTDAARYCANMTYPAGGYTDWYLPSRDELDLVLYAMYVAGEGNLRASDYGSSTEFNVNEAYTQDIANGNQFEDPKTTSYFIRCVRKY